MLTKEEIIKKKLCKTCDPSICHNDYDLCPYQHNPNGHLCLTCIDLDNEIVDGYLKCYHTCKYLATKTSDLNTWLRRKQEK